MSAKPTSPSVDSLGLLSEAKAEVEQDFKLMSPLAAAKSTGDGAESKEEGAIAEAKPAAASSSPADGIIHMVSEYLFDLFDANCMDDYHTMQAFEERAWPKFDPEVEEYTFEQQELHKEFCALFEKLTEGFIREQGYSIEQFYAEVRDAAEARPKKAAGAGPAPRPWGEVDEGDDAEEVVDVVFQVADFRLWAEEMRGIARNKLQWLARRDMDQAAYAQYGGGSEDDVTDV
eukprot:g3806.t1